MASGFSGIEQLDRLIVTCKALGSGPEYAQAAAKSTETWLRSKLASGVDPNTSAAWTKTKDGKRPLTTAASRPMVRLAGNTVIVALKGYYVFQHFQTRGRVGRRVIPKGGMPAELGNAIRLGLVEPFRQKARGAR